MLRASRPMIPKSSYYFGPPPPESAYGTAPVGQIGVHHPREILRVERDYTGGEVIQFAPIYPLELEGRVSGLRICGRAASGLTDASRLRRRGFWSRSMRLMRYSSRHTA